MGFIHLQKTSAILIFLLTFSITSHADVADPKKDALKLTQARLVELDFIAEQTQKYADLKPYQSAPPVIKKAYQSIERLFLIGETKTALAKLEEAETIMDNFGVKIDAKIKIPLLTFEKHLLTPLFNRLESKKIRLKTWPELEPEGFVKKRRVWGFRPVTQITQIAIHHTETSSLKEVYRLHSETGYLDEKGAPYMAYHFMVLPTGDVLWLNLLTERTWHVKNANLQTVGVAILGDLEANKLNDKQTHSLHALVGELKKILAIKPNHTFGHRELQDPSKKTNCPGKWGMEEVKRLR